LDIPDFESIVDSSGFIEEVCSYLKKLDCETTERQCPFLNQCDFIRDLQEKTPELIRRIRSLHCTKTVHSQCARFQVHQSLGSDAVPPLMFPEQNDWARQIIEEYECDTTTDE